MSHFIHGILSNILILPLLHTLLILKELMFDVCVGAGRCTCVWTNESGSQRTNSGTTQFFFSLLGLDLSLAWNSTGRPSFGLLAPRNLSMSSSPAICKCAASGLASFYVGSRNKYNSGPGSWKRCRNWLSYLPNWIDFEHIIWNVLYFWDFIHIFKL